MFTKTTFFSDKFKRLNMASMIRYEGSFADMNFQTIWIPKGILAKLFSKKAGLGKHSYLKYALDLVILENSCPYVCKRRILSRTCARAFYASN